MRPTIYMSIVTPFFRWFICSIEMHRRWQCIHHCRYGNRGSTSSMRQIDSSNISQWFIYLRLQVCSYRRTCVDIVVRWWIPDASTLVSQFPFIDQTCLIESVLIVTNKQFVTHNLSDCIHSIRLIRRFIFIVIADHLARAKAVEYHRDRVDVEMMPIRLFDDIRCAYGIVQR